MVLTRLSHIGEICPLSDHSYSDSPSTSNPCNNILAGTSCRMLTTNCEDHDKKKGKADSAIIITSHTVLLDLPNEILEEIFSNISYKSLGDLRSVCKRFNIVAGNVLNAAFLKLQNQMLVRFQETKSMMPRRESARRKHPLACESDILDILHMRLSLLQMTFGKHIERKNCCFFAGEILDEVLRIIRCIKTASNGEKVFKITDELFDLSTMAMEYFKEFIEPTLPKITFIHFDALDLANNRFSESDEEPDPIPQSSMVLRKRIRKIRQGMRRYNSQLSNMKRELRTYKNRIAEQNKQMVEYTERMEEYDKKFDEASRKFNTVLQELNRCKTELQYWRSKSPVQTVVCCNCFSKSHFMDSVKGDFFGEDSNGPQVVALPGIMTSPANHSIKNLQPLFDGHQLPSTSDYRFESASVSSHRGSTRFGNCKPDDNTNVRTNDSLNKPTDEISNNRPDESFNKQITKCSVNKTTESLRNLGEESSRKLPVPEESSNKRPDESSRKRNDELSNSDECSRNRIAENLRKPISESSNKRSFSSDDDSDCSVDTVGRRVKERKRLKFQ